MSIITRYFLEKYCDEKCPCKKHLSIVIVYNLDTRAQYLNKYAIFGTPVSIKHQLVEAAGELEDRDDDGVLL